MHPTPCHPSPRRIPSQRIPSPRAPSPRALSLIATAVGVLVVAAAPAPAQVVVNAPVAPEAIYAGFGAAAAGISVIDLNGFGQGSGELATTRFPLNPNLGMPGVFPPLALGTSSRDAGGAGAMTWTLDSAGNVRLVGAPAIGEVTDLHLGQPLDLVFNNDNINLNAGSHNQTNPATLATQPGNTIMVAPHPNPPALVFPPPNPVRGIDAHEPTVTTSVPVTGAVTTQSPPSVPSPLNLLVPGNPFATSVPALGLFGTSFPGVFNGPQPPPPLPPPPLPYSPFTCRQQIGHFLYGLDRTNRRVLVLNSNRFRVLATIDLPDPTSMAMAPNLRWLAVSNAAVHAVSFIDVDPLSPTFHQVVAVTNVGRGPHGLAWQPEGEALLVCNRDDDSISVIDAAAFAVRHTVRGVVRAPVDVAVTARQTAFGLATGTWFAWVLNGDGRIAVIESDRAGQAAPRVVAVTTPFAAAAAIQPDYAALGAGCWLAHRDALGLGQLSRLQLFRGGPPARVRDGVGYDSLRQVVVTMRIGGANATTPVRELLSGNSPVDLAFDDIVNAGAFPDARSSVVGGLQYAAHSGKGHVKVANGQPRPAAAPLFVAVALADTGKIDLIDLATGGRVRTLDAAGVRALAHYWRQ